MKKNFTDRITRSMENSMTERIPAECIYCGGEIKPSGDTSSAPKGGSFAGGTRRMPKESVPVGANTYCGGEIKPSGDTGSAPKGGSFAGGTRRMPKESVPVGANTYCGG